MEKAARRRKCEYTESQIQGLRLVAKILKDTREGRIGSCGKKSIRGFIELLEERTGEKFNISDVQRYEAAGTEDRRRGNIQVIHPTYLKHVAPLTGYTLPELQQMLEGSSLELSGGKPTHSQQVGEVSVTLPTPLVKFIESYAAMHQYESISQVIETALQLLQNQELEAAYRDAAQETDSEWDVAIADGLLHETW